MGSPVSPIVANLYMEFLEQQAIASAPMDCKPKLWKRYVDDVLEVIRSGATNQLTDPLNQTDPTGNIKFTAEPETERKIPFLDTLLVRKEDGHVKLLVYRKKTHTDQYLMFQSHHPLHQKLGVVRTLLDRCNSVVSEEEDKILEREHINEALQRCGYPAWSLKKVQHHMNRVKPPSKQKDNTTKKTRGLVVIPYVKGVSEQVQRLFRKHDITTAMRPHTTLRQLLVHPKDKIEPGKTSGCVYEIPCCNCDLVYIGETGRQLELRLQEHRKEVENVMKVGV